MKKILLLGLLFVVSCSLGLDHRKNWTFYVQGHWVTDVSAQLWLQTIDPTVVVKLDTLVQIKSDGSFIIPSTPGVYFTISSVPDVSGIWAIYKITIGNTTRYASLAMSDQRGLLAGVIHTNPNEPTKIFFGLKVLKR
ncbi:MAG: hypothetical protein ACRCWI_04570 [Brevinema sp.]